MKGNEVIEKINLHDKSYYVIGALAKCEVVLHHASISRFHAALVISSGVHLIDLSSKSFTFLNGQQLPALLAQPLKIGDILTFGASSRTYRLSSIDYSKIAK
jgi:pSer/pThr/pTyr-binding forkhead associated (FHA) protein